MIQLRTLYIDKISILTINQQLLINFHAIVQIKCKNKKLCKVIYNR
jgi:hypothetical protein